MSQEKQIVWLETSELHGGLICMMMTCFCCFHQTVAFLGQFVAESEEPRMKVSTFKSEYMVLYFLWVGSELLPQET